MVADHREVYPSELKRAELALVDKRRKQAWGSGNAPQKSAGPNDPMPADAVGLALSGGGIRSATFCLGVLQALARAGVLRYLDFLSTVSGGGYAGGFLGALVTRPPEGAAKGIDYAEQQLKDSQSAPLRWLRKNGRYLAPNGFGDTVLAAAVYLRNLVALQVVVLTSLVAATTAAVVLGAKVVPPPSFGGVTAPPWLTLYWLLAVLVFLFATVPLGAAYWLVRASPSARSARQPLMTSIGIALAVGVPWLLRPAPQWQWAAAVGAAAFALSWSWLGASRLWRRPKDRSDQKWIDLDRATRNRLSRWLSRSGWALLWLVGVAAIDSAGRVLVHLRISTAILSSVTGGAAGIFALLAAWRPLFLLVGKSLVPTDIKKYTPVLVTVVAAIAAIGLLVAISTWVHRIESTSNNALVFALALTLVATLCFSQDLAFLNHSSLHSLYSARLTRAYLGASNKKRSTGRGSDVTEAIDGDDLDWADYAPFTQGGPLHIVNVTLNQTVGGDAALDQRDRKGQAMAFGPCGTTVGSSYYGLWTGDGARRRESRTAGIAFGRNVQPEHWVGESTLGRWVGVSGAAVAPGLGQRTSASLSFLLGLTNVRLGYWLDTRRPALESLKRAWKSPSEARAALERRGSLGRIVSRLFAVQTLFAYELTGRFHGTRRPQWYLSDGGHFENTACYELLRRRVPFIILCDCGCDPAYTFDDLTGLVRKARIDFSADIKFLDAAEIQNTVHADLVKFFGPLDAFRNDMTKEPAEGPHALLARVVYDGHEAEASTLLVLKPGISGDESLDVRRYKEANPTFPQQSTGDQFFDEAQWESHRMLGEHIASELFRSVGASDRWAPCHMRGL